MSKRHFSIRSTFELTSNTAIQAIYSAAQYLPGFKLDLVDLMGYTGYAFRMQGDPHGRGAVVHAYDWGPVLMQALRHTGLHGRYKGGPGCIDPSPELVTEAIDLVQQSIDRGVPAMVWDLFMPEFGLIYGYDDEGSCLYGVDLYQKSAIPYERLGKGRTGELFVFVLSSSTPVAHSDALRDMLLMTLDHLEEQGFHKPPSPFRAGLEGYAAWINAFRARSIEPNGNAYMIHQLHDAREYAAAFMERLQFQWGNPHSARDSELRIIAGEAAAYYGEVARALRRLRVLFPDPYGGEPNEARQARSAIKIIQYAKSQEHNATGCLRAMAGLLQS